MRNVLDQETSPYLLQHADNPVHWQAWNADSLDRARQENKPILLSVGYAACHWCHVMAHESFENPDIAAVMNELFVSIKVDREERPDIDQIYQAALAHLGQQGGWPLTMFLTPDGEPFWGGTYFPSEPKYGRPGFTDVLRAVRRIYDEEPDKVESNRFALQHALIQQNAAGDAEPANIGPELLDRIAERILQEVDPVNGGIGGAPKFPQTYILELLWRAYRRTGRNEFAAAVTLTLDRMCQGGIYDHLGGGFARYSTDAAWLAPHFEKMLYDNAQLLRLLLLVHDETGSSLYEARIRETIEWLLREMIADGGAFAATLDADSEGEEGRFYVWREAEIDAILGTDAALFKTAYDVTPDGNWEGKTILNRNADPTDRTPEEEATLARCRQTLLSFRDRRVRPGWDDKVLADWNGLAIGSMALAAARFREPSWLEAAEEAFDFVRTGMTVDGRICHSARAGRLLRAAMLDDYANMADAALLLYETTGKDGYLEAAQDWAETVEAHYRDEANGGYFFTADDAEALIVRSRQISDNATPSGNGVMLAVLARLYLHTGAERCRARAETLIDAFSGLVRQNFFPLATFLNAVEFFHAPVQVAIIGDPDAAGTWALRNAALGSGEPNLSLTVIPPDRDLPPAHPARGKAPKDDGEPTAYVCVGPVCSLPVTSAAALIEALPKPGQTRHG
ncbi:thioredoxin domain-containing protein [Oceanibacterium hippocampi]|uniref:Spermatogenesis-associated protein 20-like TRX domain-containing protein n=1 Tax=Oceanibacterium hippocampi TaxID=745714 RepID=A0A1Y5RNC9_9PROT|nr:thioredoxin domain-containing protein [Oceanibacterium hippocampi]SLN20538.1 hypothetical protein OCH7691_00506 [Oceanibacterium hippocampi]